MTITATHSAVAVGAADAETTTPVKTTLQGTTTVISVSAQLTNGAAYGDPAKAVRVHYATTPFDLTVAEALVQLRGRDTDYIEATPANAPGGIKISSSEPISVKGGYGYIWLSYPKLLAAGTVTINLVEF